MADYKEIDLEKITRDLVELHKAFERELKKILDSVQGQLYADGGNYQTAELGDNIHGPV